FRAVGELLEGDAGAQGVLTGAEGAGVIVPDERAGAAADHVGLGGEGRLVAGMGVGGALEGDPARGAGRGAGGEWGAEPRGCMDGDADGDAAGPAVAAPDGGVGGALP